MKNNKGITMITLVITIGILLILAGISIGTGGKIIKQSELENLKTNMLLIKVKGKEYVENANFKLGTGTEEQKNEHIEQAKNELIGEEIKEGNIFEGNANISTENIVVDNTNYIYYYKLTKKQLEDIGISNISSDERNGWYIIKYDIKNIEVEVYNTNGFENEKTKYYSSKEIENLNI